MKETGALCMVMAAVVLVAAGTQVWPGQTRPAWSAENGTSSMVIEGKAVEKTDKPVDRGKEKHFPKCPRTRYINCMPPVKDRAMCDPEYLRWVKEHCPDVEVVY